MVHVNSFDHILEFVWITKHYQAISSIYFDKNFFILSLFFVLVLEGNFWGRICHQVLSDASEKSPKQYLQTWNFLLQQNGELPYYCHRKHNTQKQRGHNLFICKKGIPRDNFAVIETYKSSCNMHLVFEQGP